MGVGVRGSEGENIDSVAGNLLDDEGIRGDAGDYGGFGGRRRSGGAGGEDKNKKV